MIGIAQVLPRSNQRLVSGFVAIERDAINNPIFRGTKGSVGWLLFSRLAASALFKERPVNAARRGWVLLERGQLWKTTRMLADETGLPKTTVIRWMKRLEEADLISVKSGPHFSVVTVQKHIVYPEWTEKAGPGVDRKPDRKEPDLSKNLRVGPGEKEGKGKEKPTADKSQCGRQAGPAVVAQPTTTGVGQCPGCQRKDGEELGVFLRRFQEHLAVAHSGGDDGSTATDGVRPFGTGRRDRGFVAHAAGAVWPPRAFRGLAAGSAAFLVETAPGSAYGPQGAVSA